MSMVRGTSGGLIAHAIQLMDTVAAAQAVVISDILIFAIKCGSLMCCIEYYKRLYARLSADDRVNGFPSELSSR